MPCSSCSCSHKKSAEESSNSNDLNRQLQIKVNILKRCVKEHDSYLQEAHLQALRIKDLEAASSTDVHLLNKQRQVLGETQRMLPECAGRVEQARRDLKAFLERHADLLKSSDLAPEAFLLLQEQQQ